MKAVVLAAGEGIRLHPLTSTRPKHLLSVGGKPLLEHVLLAMRAAGVDEAVLIVHHMADQVKEYFGDGSEIEMKLEYVFQPEVRGTADATALAESYVKKDFLMIYGDLLTTAEVIKTVLQFHKKKRSPVTMAVVPVKHPEDYGVVQRMKSQVTDIIEKPSPGEAPTNLANAGIYVFSTEIFKKIRVTQHSKRGEREITDSLRLLLQEDHAINAVQIPNEEWLDVGRPWDLLEANMRVLRTIKIAIKGEIEDGVHLLGQVEVAAGARVRSGVYIEGPVYIGAGSDIGPNCYIRSYTSLGKKVRIGNACEIKNCIIMNRTSIGHLSYVGDSIIGEKCNLGAGTITANYRFDEKNVKMRVKGNVVDSGREKLGVVLGDHVKTGINTLFMPGVKIGGNTWIGPNIVVDKDVPSESFLRLEQKTVQEKTEGSQKSL